MAGSGVTTWPYLYDDAPIKSGRSGLHGGSVSPCVCQGMVGSNSLAMGFPLTGFHSSPGCAPVSTHVPVSTKSFPTGLACCRGRPSLQPGNLVLLCVGAGAGNPASWRCGQGDASCLSAARPEVRGLCACSVQVSQMLRKVIFQPCPSLSLSSSPLHLETHTCARGQAHLEARVQSAHGSCLMFSIKTN